MAVFELDPRLAADTCPIGDLALSRVLLMNDRRYPWVILVPRRPGIRELYELTASDRSALLEESCRVSECLVALFAPEKLNLGALGNLVPQLHLHHVARWRGDPAWPGPVWGHSPAVPYDPAGLAQCLAMLGSCLNLEVSATGQ
jgi:diadenosine tetraphosphate (Ap4A) HIT family hydrolase